MKNIKITVDYIIDDVVTKLYHITFENVDLKEYIEVYSRVTNVTVPKKRKIESTIRESINITDISKYINRIEKIVELLLDN